MHRVALSLGMTVAELGEKITPRELIDWMRYYQLPGEQSSIELDSLSGAEIESLLNGR